MPRGKKTVSVEVETKETKETKVNAKTDKAVVNNDTAGKTEPQPVTTKSYNETDLIPCRSIMSGYMNMLGVKSKIVYEWMGNGDVTQLEYQDLKAAMISRDVHIYSPMFIIEDENVIELPEWKAVKEVYENLYSRDDLSRILELPVDQMAQVVENLPKGGKKALVSIAREGIDIGTFDSINKIKKLDELLGTELMLFVGED